MRRDQYLTKCEGGIDNKHPTVVLNLKQFLADHSQTDRKGHYQGNLDEVEGTGFVCTLVVDNPACNPNFNKWVK